VFETILSLFVGDFTLGVLTSRYTGTKISHNRHRRGASLPVGDRWLP
jgi:hypothetical protein